MRKETRRPEAPRTSRSERGSADSGSSRRQQDSPSGSAVCCDEQMIGAERFPRKGDGEDEYDE